MTQSMIQMMDEMFKANLKIGNLLLFLLERELLTLSQQVFWSQ